MMAAMSCESQLLLINELYAKISTLASASAFQTIGIFAGGDSGGRGWLVWNDVAVGKVIDESER